MLEGMIESTSENWENRTLGCDPNFVKVHESTKEEEILIDKAIGLELVELRIEKEIVQQFITKANPLGINYKTLMRVAIKDYLKNSSPVSD